MSAFSDKFTPIDTDGYIELSITDNIQSLTNNDANIGLPDGANAAQIQIHNAAIAFSEDSEIVRFNRSPIIPVNATTGQVLGHLDFIELRNVVELKNFQFISAEAGKSGKLLIQYFKG